MSLKLKAIGLGLLAATVLSGFTVMNASATEGGHFVATGVAHTKIEGFEGGTHTGGMIIHGLEGEMRCDKSTSTATVTTETVTSVTGTGTVSGCHTVGSETTIPVHVNGCTGTATVAFNTTDSTEQTGHMLCPAGKAVEITHPNCTIKIHPQTMTTGATYTRKTSPTGQHELTVDSKVQFSLTRHGLCQFVAPTTGTGTAIGSATVKGFDTAGNQVSITAT
jgi:hypothetical protein